MSGLTAELKRRNVIRTAGLYLVGAWLLTQVASTLLPPFEVPAWALRAFVIVLALGFELALIVAFELEPVRAMPCSVRAGWSRRHASVHVAAVSTRRSSNCGTCCRSPRLSGFHIVVAARYALGSDPRRLALSGAVERACRSQARQCHRRGRPMTEFLQRLRERKMVQWAT